jgi:hypothetical protein
MKATELQVRSALAKVPLCGCGSSDAMWSIVLAILDRAEDHEKRGSFYDPMPDHGLSSNAVEFAAQALDSSDMTEHGSGIGWAWLTAAGKTVLLFLRKYGVDREKWPEWATTSVGSEPFTLTPEQWRQWAFAGRDTMTEAP